jgi:hypothetical protein
VRVRAEARYDASMLRLIGVLGLTLVVGCGGGSNASGPDGGAGTAGQAGTGGGVGGGAGNGGGASGTTGTAGGTGGGAGTGTGGNTASGWVVASEETFETTTLPAPAWATDTYPDTGFSDDGAFFRGRGVTPPRAYRASAPFGASNWLTVESYSRAQTTAIASLFSIVADPAGGTNKVLRIASPAHTDATIVRPTQPLPDRYRVSLRVGYANFGDGLDSGNNGYDDGETADPWLPGEDATTENGFYWLTILDTVPRPHNNVYIHHHRKVVMDSDNNVPPWMEIWNGSRFIDSGEMTLMMIGVDGGGDVDELSGKPFFSYANGTWQASGAIRAVNSYRPMTWYRASIERTGDQFTLEVSGNWRYGGTQTYTATIDAAGRCVWHFNRQALAAGSPCADTSHYPSLPGEPPLWPADIAWPDYFMFGDPHNNFYEGEVYYDDVRLEVWR